MLLYKLILIVAISASGLVKRLPAPILRILLWGASHRYPKQYAHRVAMEQVGSDRQTAVVFVEDSIRQCTATALHQTMTSPPIFRHVAAMLYTHPWLWEGCSGIVVQSGHANIMVLATDDEGDSLHLDITTFRRAMIALWVLMVVVILAW